jgi:hypothetical protein
MPSRSRPAVAALLLAALLLARPSPAQDQLVERILAVAEGRPVLLSEVRLIQALRGLDEQAALEELIDERLMLREAGRLAASAVTAAEEERAFSRLRETSAAARAAPEAGLRRLVRRQTAIVKYVDFRFRPQVSVGEALLRSTYEQRYADRTAAPSFEEAAPLLREELLSQLLDQRIEAWVAELRKTAAVRYNAPP